MASYNVQPLKTQDEISTFKFFLSRNKYGERDVFLFLLGINTGLRMSDIVKLTVRDVTETKYVIEQKTGKRRRLSLDGMKDIINQYTLGMQPDEYLFKSREGGFIEVGTVWKIFNKAAREMGRSDLGTHTCRKTFGYHYYKRTKDIATLMIIFNHSSESITKRYIGITDDEIDDSLVDFKLGF